MTYTQARQSCLDLSEALLRSDSSIAYTKPVFFSAHDELDQSGGFRLLVRHYDGHSGYVGHYLVSE